MNCFIQENIHNNKEDNITNYYIITGFAIAIFGSDFFQINKILQTTEVFSVFLKPIYFPSARSN